ncbi:MAG: glycosyltransferase [Solirubrobacteraceae bacterium]
MPELAFVMSPGQDWFLQELVETIRYELELQGIPSSMHTDGFPKPRPDLVYALPAPRQFVALEGPEALPDQSILKRTAFICADPPKHAVDEDDFELFASAGAVFDIDVRSVVALHRGQISARTLRPGYSKLRDRFDCSVARPIDVMFLGTRSERRTRLLSRYAPILARHNCLVQIADAEYPNAAGSSSFLTESKRELLAQTKVMINLHRDQESYIEWLRVLDAMHCGAVVVSEHATGFAPFVAGQHLLLASSDALPFVAEAVLRDDALAQRLRMQAYERLSEWLPFALSIGVLRAALVELVGHPVPPGAWRGRSPAAPLVAVGRWDPVVEAPDPALRGLERELQHARVELVEVRRQVADLQRMILSSAGAPGPRVFDETPAWRARRRPRISVLLTFRNEADRLVSTLDSVATSWMHDLELIVVDVASHDGAAETAAAWLRAHQQVPARLVVQDVELGRGAARNVALDQARAHYCFVLDPGYELFGRCFDVLLGTLDAMPDVAFAYPIVQVTGLADGVAPPGGERLLNFLGWEPLRLRLGNYIQPPYLIRRDRLRELGGFAEAPRLQGLEDYDLWCRVAERGWRGQLVPQILVRQRSSSSSAGSSAIGPATSFGLGVLAERAPKLMAGLG